MSHKKKNIKWTSKIGFIMTAAGAAVGLGNLQRFPQLVAQNGGGAFLLIYLLCVILFALPIMLSELSLGRAFATDPINSFIKAAPKKKYWKYVGAFSSLIAFFILSYYIVSCAWTLRFVLKSFSSDKINFEIIASQPNKVIWYLLIFHAIVTIIVYKGLNNGVEKFSKIVMPILFVIQVLLIVKIIFLKGSLEGILYYLKPDFSKLKPNSFLTALSQAFFSLCIGESVLLTYGSYSSKEENLPLSASYIAILDTGVAFFAGLIIIPAMFISKIDPNQGIGLIYNSLLAIFSEMTGGSIFLIMYFVILAIAGLTTCITLLDVSSNTFGKAFNISKKYSVLMLSISALILSIPNLYSKGGSTFLSNISILGNRGFYYIMDYVWGSLCMVICGLLTTIFVGWVWGVDKAANELEKNTTFFKKIKNIWSFHIKWTAPIIIIYILKEILYITK